MATTIPIKFFLNQSLSLASGGRERFMRQHSVMSGALRRLLFIQIKKRFESQSFCLLFLLTKKK
jgi:hypothetical protein